MIDWGTVIEKVPEVAMVLIFIWFTLKMLTMAKDFLHTRDDAFFASLKTLEDRHNKEIESVSEDLQSQSTIMKKICDQMSAHTKLLKFIAEDVRKQRASTPGD
jgi:hypothetical protein